MPAAWAVSFGVDQQIRGAEGPCFARMSLVHAPSDSVKELPAGGAPKISCVLLSGPTADDIAQNDGIFRLFFGITTQPSVEFYHTKLPDVGRACAR